MTCTYLPAYVVVDLGIVSALDIQKNMVHGIWRKGVEWRLSPSGDLEIATDGSHVVSIEPESYVPTIYLKPAPRRNVSDEPTQLYRHFDASGRLLYVGISLSTAHRLGQHKNKSQWFRKIANIQVETYPTRDEAYIAETQAILKEKPLFNIAKVSSRNKQ